MALDAHEFIRRFLMHVLPDGFMRIRSFGFLANSCKTKKIQRIFELLKQQPVPSIEKESAEELMLRITGIDINLCPKCKTGKLQTIKILPNFKQLQYGKYQDSS